MMKKIDKDKKRNKQFITRHLSKWAWLGDHNYTGEFWTNTYIDEQIKNFKNKNITKEILSIKNSPKNFKNKYETITKNWNLNMNERDTIDLAKKFAYFRTFRLDALFFSEFMVQNLWQEISKRLGINYKELLLMTPWEINDAITKKDLNLKTKLKDRQKSYAILLKNYKINIHSGLKAEQFAEIDKKNTNIFIIKGQTAFKGSVKGKIKIIMNKSDFKNFKDKEMLVTPMTTPDFVPLMKRCSAIITDEGGITCHAAIVSREMKKPCVIGTKNATQVLKNGMEIEVSADKGIIQILNT